MATNDHLREKLIEARHILACHPHAIKNRLEAAFLRFAPIEIENVDEPYRCAYKKIVSALLAKDNIKATLKDMDQNDAVEVVRSILDLLDDLERDRPHA